MLSTTAVEGSSPGTDFGTWRRRVAGGQRRDPYDWEWREAEYERRRQRARVIARRRGRLRLAAVIFTVAAVAGSALLAARAVSLPAPRSAEPVAACASVADGAGSSWVDER
jgi:hypothetical protein